MLPIVYERQNSSTENHLGEHCSTEHKYNSSIEEISELYHSLSEESLSDRITSLLEISNIPSKLGDYGIKKESFKDLANEASGQWTGNFNPKQTDHADFMNLYESAL